MSNDYGNSTTDTSKDIEWMTFNVKNRNGANLGYSVPMLESKCKTPPVCIVLYFFLFPKVAALGFYTFIRTRGERIKVEV